MTPDDPLDPAGVDLPLEPGSNQSDAVAKVLPSLFARIAAAKPSFVPPITEVGIDVWVRGLSDFTAQELTEAVQFCINRMTHKTPGIADIRNAGFELRAERAEKIRQAERVIDHIEDNNSARGYKPGRLFCPACGQKTPMVALARRRDGTVSARSHPCACFGVADPQYTTLVPFDDFRAVKLDYGRVSWASAEHVDRMLGNWAPNYWPNDPRAHPELDRVREMLQE